MEKLHMLRYRWQYQYRFQHLRWGPEDCAGGGQFRCQVHFPSLLIPELICRAISVVPLPLNSQELNLADVKSPLKVISQPRSWNQRNWSHMHAHLQVLQCDFWATWQLHISPPMAVTELPNALQKKPLPWDVPSFGSFLLHWCHFGSTSERDSSTEWNKLSSHKLSLRSNKQGLGAQLRIIHAAFC